MLNKIIQELEAKIANEHYIIAQYAYRDTIKLIKSHLPQFEEEIKKAYLDGALSQLSTDNKNVTPQDYFNQNYGNEK